VLPVEHAMLLEPNFSQEDFVAQKTIVRLIDDLDGGDADENILFAVDGIEYSIDLSKGNADKLRDALEPFVGNAQRVGGRKKGSGVYSGGVRLQRPGTDKAQNQAIRAWAASQDIKLSDRGRIPRDVVERFNAAH